MTNSEIANQLKALGLREFGVSVWSKTSDTPKFSGVTAEVKANQFGASLNIPAGDGGFVPVRLAKMPNAKPIKKGDMTAFAH